MRSAQPDSVWESDTAASNAFVPWLTVGSPPAAANMIMPSRRIARTAELRSLSDIQRPSWSYMSNARSGPEQLQHFGKGEGHHNNTGRMVVKRRVAHACPQKA